MKAGGLAFVSIFLFSYNVLPAQDFDGDSVYYTSIPKPVVPHKKNRSARNEKFKDTVFLDQKPIYFFSIQSGSLIGCNDCSKGKDVSSTLSIVNGVTIRGKIRAGIGLGFDSYVGWHTSPAFVSLSWDVIGNKNRSAFFIQLACGYSKAWRQKSYQTYAFQKAEGGRMLAPQLGYRLKYHDLNLSLAVGTKLQRVFSYYEYPTWRWVNGAYQPGTDKSTIKQDMSRLTVTMIVGWR